MEVVDQWNREIDGLLTFVSVAGSGFDKTSDRNIIKAGLFSAILTAFNVQSYQLLQPATTDILLRMSLQLETFIVTTPGASNPTSFVNSTRPAYDSTAPLHPFRPPAYAIWLNILWFSSLVFSISSATIGIIVKQWLKEHSMGLYGNSRDIARRRQHRLSNLRKWRVATIVALIPVLLLIALFLFLTGLIVLVWSIHPTVAYFVTVLSGLLFLFLAMTTFLPTFCRSCCYYSPQSHRVFVILRRTIYPLLCRLVYELLSPAYRLFDWTTDHNYFWDAWRGVSRLRESLDAIARAKVTWKPDHRHFTATESTSLDIKEMVTAYEVSLNMKAIEAAETCLPDTPERMIYLEDLNKIFTRRFGLPDDWPAVISSRFLQLTNRMALAHLSPATSAGNTSWTSEAQELCLRTIQHPVENDANPRHLEHFSRRWPAELIGTLAVLSMDWKTHARTAHEAWEELNNGLIGQFRWFRDVDDPLVCQTSTCPSSASHYVRSTDSAAVAVAATARLEGLRQDTFKAEDIPKREGRILQWELDFAHLHLRAAWRPTADFPVDSSTSLTDIAPTLRVLEQTLKAICRVLETMDWTLAERQPSMESWACHRLLDSIDSMFSDDRTRGLVDLPLVSQLIATLCQLIKGPGAAEEPTADNWAHLCQVSDDPDIRECGEILEKHRYTLYRPTVGQPGEGEIPEEAVDSQDEDEAQPVEGGHPSGEPGADWERPVERAPFAGGESSSRAVQVPGEVQANGEATRDGSSPTE